MEKNFVSYAEAVSKVLLSESQGIEQAVLSGMSGTLDQYKHQTGTLRGIAFALSTMRDLRDKWLKDGMEPKEDLPAA